MKAFTHTVPFRNPISQSWVRLFVLDIDKDHQQPYSRGSSERGLEESEVSLNVLLNPQVP